MAAAAFTSVALLATACGGGGTTEEPGTDQGATGGEISMAGCTPENALIPGNTSEACGGDIVDSMTAKLVRYNTDNAEPENDIAESIETTDNTNFTIKLKPDYKFHDGTVVKAKNFVDAWNYTSYGPNGQAGAAFFSVVAGYNDLTCPDEKCAQKPKAETMSGLKVVDDTTFTLQTAEPVSNLPVRLGYSTFAPLPDSFFADPKAFEAKPIGAGPFQLASKSNTEFVLSKFPEYSGTDTANVDKLTFKIYQDPSAAYNDVLGGNLDFIDDSYIPADQLVGEAYKSDFPDRTSQREVLRVAWITFSPNDPQLKGKPELRKAISRAIDRDLIAKQIWNGTVTPATSWVPPSVPGHQADICGDSCKFDAAAAKQAFDAAGGYKGTLTMTYNADAPNKAWSEAVCNSIKNTLGIECTAVPTVDFATFNNKIDANELKGIFRSSWQGDYPSIENFLNPIYAKGADSNWSKYDNPEFTKLTAEAASKKTDDEATVLYQQAEALLAEDFPTAPLWYPKGTAIWSEKVTDVKLNAFGVLDTSAIKLK
jgi:oligopeptide transport system substrate-binding protein